MLVRAFRPVCFTVLLCAAACSEEAPFAGPCEEDSDCADGLFCASTGELESSCTVTCGFGENDLADRCKLRFGARAFCHDTGGCALACESSEDCPNASQCKKEDYYGKRGICASYDPGEGTE